MDLRGKRALVTGGAVRLGRAICEELAAAGCNVAVHYQRSEAEALELADRLGKAGVTAVPVRGPLSGEAEAESVLADAWARLGAVDLLVNSAAVFHKDSLLAATEEKLLAELRTNCLGPFFLLRALARRVLARPAAEGAAGPEAKVVNLLDRRIAGNPAGCLPYLLSKQALAALTRSAAVELAPRLTVNAVAPGAILPPPGTTEERVREAAGVVPLGRAGTPADVARAVRFLLEADTITGQIIFVDGGQHLV